MKINRELIRKIEIGDALSDTELKTAYKFYNDLYESICCLGKEYTLFRLNIYSIKSSLESFAFFRKLKLGKK